MGGFGITMPEFGGAFWDPEKFRFADMMGLGAQIPPTPEPVVPHHQPAPVAASPPIQGAPTPPPVPKPTSLIDPTFMATVKRIESGGNPLTVTGSNKGLYQFGPREWAKYGQGGNIYDPAANTAAARAKFADDAAAFQKSFGREPTPAELYMTHQQGRAGAAAHYGNPEGVAWQNVRKYYPSDAMAKQAIWGNVPRDVRSQYPGGVNDLTSKQFTDMWADKYTRFAGQGAPPTPAVANVPPATVQPSGTGPPYQPPPLNIEPPPGVRLSNLPPPTTLPPGRGPLESSLYWKGQPPPVVGGPRVGSPENPYSRPWETRPAPPAPEVAGNGPPPVPAGGPPSPSGYAFNPRTGGYDAPQVAEAPPTALPKMEVDIQHTNPRRDPDADREFRRGLAYNTITRGMKDAGDRIASADIWNTKTNPVQNDPYSKPAPSEADKTNAAKPTSEKDFFGRDKSHKNYKLSNEMIARGVKDFGKVAQSLYPYDTGRSQEPYTVKQPPSRALAKLLRGNYYGAPWGKKTTV